MYFLPSFEYAFHFLSFEGPKTSITTVWYFYMPLYAVIALDLHAYCYEHVVGFIPHYFTMTMLTQSDTHNAFTLIKGYHYYLTGNYSNALRFHGMIRPIMALQT